SIFLFLPHPGRLVTMPWAVNFLMTLRTVDTGTLRSPTMDLRLSMLFYNFGSQTPRQFFALLSFVHAQCGIHRPTTQRLSQLCSILTGCKCDLYVTSICDLPQVSLNTN